MTGPGGTAPSWSLPPLMPFGGDWAPYEELLYQRFLADLVSSPIIWRGKRVTVKREPLLNGKEDGFWHIVTETGPSGAVGDRIPHLDRCARIGWIKAVLTAPATEVKTFGQMRQGRQHFAVALNDFSYVVFLRDWPDTVQLMTAYSVDSSGKREDYRKQWEADKR